MAREIAVVTGGLGFIGSHMVDLLLEEGFLVRVIDDGSCGSWENLKHHQDNPYLSVEMQDIRTLEKQSPLFQGASYVFHFAGIGDIVPSVENPEKYMDINVQGTVKVLQAASYAKVKKLVYAASSSCYGLAKTPTKEDHPICVEYPYALSKYLGELTCFHWHKVYQLPVNSIRIFNAYGTRSKTSGAYGAVMGVFLKQKLSNKPFTVVGDGEQKRDFVYVTDLVKAFYKAAKTPLEGEIFNIGAGKPQSINRLVEILGGEKVFIPERPKEPKATWANTEKAASLLDWHPTLSFEEGMKNLIENISYWEKAPLWDASSISNSTKTWFTALGR